MWPRPFLLRDVCRYERMILRATEPTGHQQSAGTEREQRRATTAPAAAWAPERAPDRAAAGSRSRAAAAEPERPSEAGAAEAARRGLGHHAAGLDSMKPSGHSALAFAPPALAVWSWSPP